MIFDSNVHVVIKACFSKCLPGIYKTENWNMEKTMWRVLYCKISAKMVRVQIFDSFNNVLVYSKHLKQCYGNQNSKDWKYNFDFIFIKIKKIYIVAVIQIFQNCCLQPELVLSVVSNCSAFRIHYVNILVKEKTWIWIFALQALMTSISFSFC